MWIDEESIVGRNQNMIPHPPSPPLTLPLPPAPGAPHSLSVAAVTSSSLRINWVQPHSPNGVIQHYKVYYQCTSSDCPLLYKQVRVLLLDHLSH